MSTEQSDPWIGTTVDGRYEIEDRVARGGMSTVYLARDARLGRHVALKVLFPHMAEDRKVVERFEQEARNAALISHPNVVQVLDQGQTRETAYLVMEHVPGATLRTLLKRGPMTPRLALTYTEAILQGLGAAHRAGLVHRDIKPENVLVSRDGRIKLADFGLARAATHHSGTSTLMGTVAYISPELLSGDGADERADIYAVGILLYEMLTGVQPYTGDSPVRVAFQHVNSTVPAPSAAVSGLAPALDEIVRAATRQAVEERPKHADELLALVAARRRELTEEQLDHAPAAATETSPGASSGTAPSAAEDSSSEDAAGGDGAAPPSGTAVLPTAGTGAGSVLAASAGADQGPLSRSPDEDATQALGAQEEFPTREESEAWDDDVAAALLHARAGATLDVAERQTVAEVPTEAFRSLDPAEGQAAGEHALGVPPGDMSDAGAPADAGAPSDSGAPGHGDAADAAVGHGASGQAADAGPASAPEEDRTEVFAWTADAPAPRPSAPAAEETSEFSAVGSSQAAVHREDEEDDGPDRGPSAWIRRRTTPSPGDDRRRRQRPTVELQRPTPTRTWLTIAVLMICTALLVLFSWYLGLSPEIIPSLGGGEGTVEGGPGTGGTTPGGV